MSDPKLNLHQRMLAVWGECSYVRKDANIPGAGKGVARDAVVAEIRGALIKHGVLAYTTQIRGERIASERKSSSGTPLSIYVGLYETRFVNVDKPEESIVVQHEAEGQDYGDKAPGKAATYAEKLNLIKGLMLETGIADEGRNPGDGDEPAASPEKPAIRAPRAKGADAPAKAAEPANDEPASKGLIEMLKADAIAKNVLAQVETRLKKGGHSLEAMPKSVAVKVRAFIESAPTPEREPGQEG